MNLKPSAKYYLHSMKPAIIIFYIVLAVLSVASIFLSFLLSDSNSSFGGIAAASIIFLFVMGICSFFEEFKMFNQNGISRHEVWKSFLISSTIVAAIMSAIDLSMLGILSSLINAKSLILEIASAYLDNIVLQVICTYFLQIVFYTLALSVGYLIRLIYFRMNKFGRTTVSIAVPAFFFIALPILSTYYNLEPIFGVFFGFLGKIMKPGKFYGLPMVYIFFIMLIAVVAIINKLLIKKATIK